MIQPGAVQVRDRRWAKSLVALFLITGLVVVDGPGYAVQAASNSTILGTTGSGPIGIVVDAAGNINTANAVLRPTGFQAKPIQVWCDKKGWASVKIEREAFSTQCPKYWVMADPNLVLCINKNWSSRGFVRKYECPAEYPPVLVDSSMKYTIWVLAEWTSSKKNTQPTTTTTVAGSKPQELFAGTFCENKLTKLTDIELRNILWNVQMLKRGVNYRIGGTTPKISSAWGDEKRCVSAEMISRLSKSGKISPGVEGKCVDETYWFGRGDMQFFPRKDTKLSFTWFFGPLLANTQNIKKEITGILGDCGGIKRTVAACANGDLAVDDAQVKEAVPINLIKHGCMFAPDGRLVLENLAPVWKTQDENQILIHSYGVTINPVMNYFEGTRFDLPANGCLSQMEDSECKEGFNPLGLTEGQKCLIKNATQHLGFLYGKSGGLTGIDEGLQLSKGQGIVTYDCVSLAKVLVPKIKNVFSASEINKNATVVKWRELQKITEWEDINKKLPVGTLLSTENHVRVVVGHLQLQDGTFNPIVVEAANSFVGVVRARILMLTTLDGIRMTDVVLAANYPQRCS